MFVPSGTQLRRSIFGVDLGRLPSVTACELSPDGNSRREKKAAEGSDAAKCQVRRNRSGNSLNKVASRDGFAPPPAWSHGTCVRPTRWKGRGVNVLTAHTSFVACDFYSAHVKRRCVAEN